MERRYDLQALAQAADLSESGLARAVGMSGSTLKSARTRGLSYDTAERYAMRLGFMAVEVWRDFGFELCHGCTRTFAPSRKGHRYCSTRCYQNEYQRRWRAQREATDPAFKAARRAGTAAWRERSRRTKRIKDRAYYERNAETIRAKARARYHARRAETREDLAA